jgi:two-component system CheB/CheR fusion protein
MLKITFGLDFTHYKENTINRRITRRMVINKTENLKTYVDCLRSNPTELQGLFDDLLIGVTSFFREPKTFAALKETVLPELAKEKSLSTPLRIWVPGCSTGEEVYSLGIIIQEFLEENNIVDVHVQIFGTDANEKNIDRARQAIYPKVIEDNVSENRLKRFFNKTNGNYQIIKTIREMCIFAKHDLTVDPPFSSLSLIMCRNVLIYFDSFLHERVLPVFHYGLKQEGFLVLGESESVGKFQYLFDPIMPKSPLYKKKKTQPQVTLVTEPSVHYTTIKSVKTAEKTDKLTLLKDEVDHLLLEQYIPATLLISDNLEVLFLRGQVDSYLTHEPGIASLNINRIVRKELRPIVQTAIYRVRKENTPITETTQFEQKKQPKTVELQVKPLTLSGYKERFFLITFRETLSQTYLSTQAQTTLTPAEIERIKDRQIRELKEDLEATKQSLQTIVESHEATNEELRLAMEESQSSNEELQSINEELETAKEEMQSSNEELHTLNEELKNRNQDLTQVNDDLVNLISNIDTSILIVDNNFKIRRFTAPAQELLKITLSNRGHTITDILTGVQIQNLENLLQDVTTKLVSVKQEVSGNNNHFYEMRIRPYLTSEKKIDGAVLSFVDITERKLLENAQLQYTDNLETQIKEQANKIVQSERLAAIGETAGMVGHDIRNPLQAIISELYLAKSDLTNLPDGEEKKNLQDSILFIENQISYIKKIVTDLQDYAKILQPNLVEVNICQIITETLKTLNFPANVQTGIICDQNIPKLKADPTFLRRIVTNLTSNAIQAMPNGGKLTVNVFTKDKQTLLTVEDTGVGMSEETKKKVFQPLFTTKAKGQGFGLVVIKRMTEALGGTISFESQEGKGTKFTVSLPV